MAIDSLIGFIKTLKKILKPDNYEYFYRGHSDSSFLPLPSVYRKSVGSNKNSYIQHENDIFREVIIRTPAEFSNEITVLEKLVKMQHYGLPTRILDVTSNPLVALFFACNQGQNSTEGEVLVFKVPKSELKYYDSDTVSILSNITKMDISFDVSLQVAVYYDYDGEYYDTLIRDLNKMNPIPYLIHEIQNEKYQFQPIIDPTDFNRVLAVKVKQTNSRILKQSGAFLLFGINNKKPNPATIPDEWILNKSFKHFNLKITATEKENILNDLNAIAINNSTLFPELERQTEYIKQLYR